MTERATIDTIYVNAAAVCREWSAIDVGVVFVLDDEAFELMFAKFHDGHIPYPYLPEFSVDATRFMRKSGDRMTYKFDKLLACFLAVCWCTIA